LATVNNSGGTLGPQGLHGFKQRVGERHDPENSASFQVGLTQSDSVLKALGCELALLVIVKPEADAIEEMETHLIDDAMSLQLILSSEQTRSTRVRYLTQKVTA
jgi:hypothetical protein